LHFFLQNIFGDDKSWEMDNSKATNNLVEKNNSETSNESTLSPQINYLIVELNECEKKLKKENQTLVTKRKIVETLKKTNEEIKFAFEIKKGELNNAFEKEKQLEINKKIKTKNMLEQHSKASQELLEKVKSEGIQLRDNLSVLKDTIEKQKKRSFDEIDLLKKNIREIQLENTNLKQKIKEYESEEIENIENVVPVTPTVLINGKNNNDDSLKMVNRNIPIQKTKKRSRGDQRVIGGAILGLGGREGEMNRPESCSTEDNQTDSETVTRIHREDTYRMTQQEMGRNVLRNLQKEVVGSEERENNESFIFILK
jgi:hypothetical protein